MEIAGIAEAEGFRRPDLSDRDQVDIGRDGDVHRHNAIQSST